MTQPAQPFEPNGPDRSFPIADGGTHHVRHNGRNGIVSMGNGPRAQMTEMTSAELRQGAAHMVEVADYLDAQVAAAKKLAEEQAAAKAASAPAEPPAPPADAPREPAAK